MKKEISKILKSRQSHWDKVYDLALMLPEKARRLLACDFADRALARVDSQGVSPSSFVADARRIAEGSATEDERRKFYATAYATATAAAAYATAAAAATTVLYYGIYGFRFDFKTDDPGILAEREWQLKHIVEVLEAQEVQP